YDKIYITEAKGRPYIFFLFYNRQNVNNYLDSSVIESDPFGFKHVRRSGNLYFGLDDLTGESGKIMAVTSENNIPGGFSTRKFINNLSGDIVFVISDNL
ncbi:MAG: hypothetical protein R3321_11790, partial [Nitrososphaeraceae archaeon]|nr:hypothetical protein [Nitrososphaeraceae archaeon]